MGYLPKEDHGVIGDLHTAALVGIDGTTDWLRLPRFDAPSVFAAILDDEKGGHLKLAPGTTSAANNSTFVRRAGRYNRLRVRKGDAA